jgi:Trypsin Inhibitor like cysteine rich domain
MPSPRFCRNLRTLSGGEADQDLSESTLSGSMTGSDYGDCIQGCVCSAGLLLDDRGDCTEPTQCTCYDTYNNRVVDASESADLLCGTW